MVCVLNILLQVHIQEHHILQDYRARYIPINILLQVYHDILQDYRARYMSYKYTSTSIPGYTAGL